MQQRQGVRPSPPAATKRSAGGGGNDEVSRLPPPAVMPRSEGGGYDAEARGGAVGAVGRVQELSSRRCAHWLPASAAVCASICSISRGREGASERERGEIGSTGR